MRRTMIFLAVALMTISLAGAASARVLRVAPGGSSSATGESWAQALDNPATALERARSGDEIWVAAGTYLPGGRRSASFTLQRGVALYGGFTGTETSLDQRDPARNATVLSGDIGRPGMAEDNCYHVVTGADDAVLDGFTVTGGYSLNARPGNRSGAMNGRPGFGSPGMGGPNMGGRNMGRPGGGPGMAQGMGGPGGTHTTPQAVLSGPGNNEGAGMINYQASPVVRNCLFTDNQAFKGGGVYNMASTGQRPGPQTSTWSRTGMRVGSGAGPMGNSSQGSGRAPTFINCTFADNLAAGRGGGVANDLNTSPTFLSCEFRGNRCMTKGGGMYNDFGCSPLVINCLFTGNRAVNAGAMGNDGGSAPVIYYSTFTANQADNSGPALYQGTGKSNDPAVVRSIVWGNQCQREDPSFYNWHESQPMVENSVIQGGYTGPGNSAQDPGLNANGVSRMDAGYKPGDARFSEVRLPALIHELSTYRKAASRPRPQPTSRWQGGRTTSSGRIIRVDGRSNGGDGTSWQNAYNSLSRALDDARRDGADIWLADGTYYPEGTGRTAAFMLGPGVRIYGGFAGNEHLLTQRDYLRYESVLSGDIGRKGDSSDNSYHVVSGANGALLDGLTVTGGNANGQGRDSKGGGLINYPPTSGGNTLRGSGYSTEVRNCLFTDNSADEGGAAFNAMRSEPKFENCLFQENRARNGGAVAERVGVQSRYLDCQFIFNTARWRGGALYSDYGARPVVDDCSFEANTSGGFGGAIHAVSRASQLENTGVTLTDCTFEHNSATGDGGAADLRDKTLAIVQGCTFEDNRAGRLGGAMAVTENSRILQQENVFLHNTAAKGAGTYMDDSAGIFSGVFPSQTQGTQQPMGQGQMQPNRMGPGQMGPGGMGQGNMGQGQMRPGMNGPQGGFGQGQGRPPAPDEVISRFDRDGDNRLSRSEAPPPVLQRFDEMDANHDGYVEASEFLPPQ